MTEEKGGGGLVAGHDGEDASSAAEGEEPSSPTPPKGTGATRKAAMMSSKWQQGAELKQVTRAVIT